MSQRCYGRMAWFDRSRAKLSIFPREEACAIVGYLEYKRDMDAEGLYNDGIAVALREFWKVRAKEAPTQAELR